MNSKDLYDYSILNQKPISKQQAINTYRAISEIKSPSKQRFTVFAYFLLDNPSDEYGFIINLGNFKTLEEANKLVNHIIYDIGHSGVHIARTCSWSLLTTKFN